MGGQNATPLCHDFFLELAPQYDTSSAAYELNIIHGPCFKRRFFSPQSFNMKEYAGLQIFSSISQHNLMTHLTKIFLIQLFSNIVFKFSLRSQTNPFRNCSSTFSVGLPRSAYAVVSIVSIFTINAVVCHITVSRDWLSRLQNLPIPRTDRPNS